MTSTATKRALDRPPADGRAAKSRPPTRTNASRWYEGRVWHGMNLGGWLRLLGANRFAVGWRQTPMALSITLFSAINTLLGWLERTILGRQIDRVQLDPEPVFILGHWRTGTTLLHELLAQDPRHTFPTTYQCFAPNHFLISRRLVRAFLPFMLPRERPMDRMRMGFDRPQEDESALCNLGLPSPFLAVAFPNRISTDPRYVDVDDLSATERSRWQDAWLRFLKRVTWNRPGRLIVKSPQHTFRLPTLLSMFPRAKFVYLVRDPVVVYPSTLHFWRSMFVAQGLQRPTFDGLEEQVLSTFERMHRRLEATRELIPEENFHTLRYEDLIADPLGQLRALYERLNLGEFSIAEAAVRRYLDEVTDYQRNRYRPAPQQDAMVRERWRAYADEHGYR